MLYVVCDLQGGILVCIFAFLAYIISILGFWFVYIRMYCTFDCPMLQCSIHTGHDIHVYSIR